MISTGALRSGTLAASDGCRLVYATAGSGPTVVFVHGGLARASGWIGVADLLADAFTCLMVDQRGHGASDRGGGPDVARAAQDLLAVIDAFCESPMLRPMFTELVAQAPSIAPALRSCVRLDTAEPYRAITVPTLLLLGSASAEVPFRSDRRPL